MGIVIPPLVYGMGTRNNRLSIQLPALIRYFLKHGYAGQVGEGLSVWSQVHVEDLAHGYMNILHWLERTSVEQVATNAYWFCENGHEYVLGIGCVLYEEGRIDSSVPRTIPTGNYTEIFGDYTSVTAGSNSWNRASRLRNLGWKPMEKSTLASLADEILFMLKTQDA